jgi:1-acyl-sn-glycerol-3-phosphate acyltransferase
VVLVVLFVATLVLLPVLAVLAALVSPWLPGHWRGLRLLGFALVGLTIELATMLAALAMWVASGFGWKLHTDAFVRAHYHVIRVSLGSLVVAGQHLFKLRLETDGVSWSPLDDGVPGSTNAMIVMSRHAGPGDSLLLVDTLMNRDHLRKPRTVMKDTLQLDPFVDVYFNRLPSRFINPDPAVGHDVEATISTLAADIGSQDALLIFPEGGNFTPRRRTRAILRLRERGHTAYAERAETMRNVLPPRPGGVLAALDAAPHADVVFVAHTGLEHLATARDVWRELPEDKTLHLRWWFYAAREVPTGRDARLNWLFERWADIDDWIAANREE